MKEMKVYFGIAYTKTLSEFCLENVTLNCVHQSVTQHIIIISLILSGMTEALASSVAFIVHGGVVLPSYPQWLP